MEKLACELAVGDKFNIGGLPCIVREISTFGNTEILFSIANDSFLVGKICTTATTPFTIILDSD